MVGLRVARPRTAPLDQWQRDGSAAGMVNWTMGIGGVDRGLSTLPDIRSRHTGPGGCDKARSLIPRAATDQAPFIVPRQTTLRPGHHDKPPPQQSSMLCTRLAKVPSENGLVRTSPPSASRRLPTAESSE